MTGDPTTPPAWANLMVRLWGKDRFPVDVRQIALEYSKTRFPNDPIRDIAQAPVKTFEGALMPLQKRGGWAILYNPAISSEGRINYTLGHEYGHYLCHRHQVPGGFECGQSAVLGQAGKSGDREREADKFASYLLMPLDDYRAQVGQQGMSTDILRHCADRYGVSLTAAALKWIEYTPACAVVVVSINGFISWCRRSEAAMKSRLFFPSGIPLPAESLAARGVRDAPVEGVSLGPGVWSRREVREMAIFADQYEMAISLLVFDPSGPLPFEWNAEPVEDAFARMTRN